MELTKRQIAWFQATNAKAELTLDAHGLPLWRVLATKITMWTPGSSIQVSAHGYNSLKEAVDAAIALTLEKW